MKKFRNRNLLYSVVVFVAGAVAALLVNRALVTSPVLTNTVHTSDTVYLDTMFIVNINNPEPYFIDTGSLIVIPTLVDVDTAKIVDEYLNRVYYSDTIVDDSLLYLQLDETVTRNRIVHRSLSYKIKQPKLINTTSHYYQISEKNLLAGPLIGSSPSGLALGFSTSYVFDNKHQISFNADLVGKRFLASYQIPIYKLKFNNHGKND